MSHDVHLTKTTEFRFALSLPLLFSGGLIFYHGWQEGYIWDFSLAGIYFAYEKFKIFLSIAALVFPCVALVASNHRSKQTLEQIKITNAQNTFSNFFKHREEFMKYLDVMEEEFSIVFKDRAGLYGKIFPSNSFETFSPVCAIANGSSYLDAVVGRYNLLSVDLISINQNMKAARRFLAECFCLGDSLNFSAAVSSEDSINNIDQIIYWAGERSWSLLFKPLQPFLHLKVAGEVLTRLCFFAMHRPSEPIAGWAEPAYDTRRLFRDVFNENVVNGYLLFSGDKSEDLPRDEFKKV